MKKIVKSNKAPAAIGPYSQAIVVGSTIYVSGQLGLDPATGYFAGDDVRSQAVQAFKNIESILKEAESDFTHVIKTTCFIKNMDDFVTVNEVYTQFFKEGDYPARSVLEVVRLPKDALVEIETIAIKK